MIRHVTPASGGNMTNRSTETSPLGSSFVRCEIRVFTICDTDSIKRSAKRFRVFVKRENVSPFVRSFVRALTCSLAHRRRVHRIASHSMLPPRREVGGSGCRLALTHFSCKRRSDRGLDVHRRRRCRSTESHLLPVVTSSSSSSSNNSSSSWFRFFFSFPLSVRR